MLRHLMNLSKGYSPTDFGDFWIYYRAETVRNACYKYYKLGKKWISPMYFAFRLGFVDLAVSKTFTYLNP